jgi:hypothetical protein
MARKLSPPRPAKCGTQPAHESLLSRRLKAPPPAVGIPLNSAWAKPGGTRVAETLDGEHESRLLKKRTRELRFRGRVGYSNRCATCSSHAGMPGSPAWRGERDIGKSGDYPRDLLSAPRAQAQERAQELAPVVAEIRAAGASSLRAIAAGLNDRGIPTAHGAA